MKGKNKIKLAAHILQIFIMSMFLLLSLDTPFGIGLFIHLIPFLLLFSASLASWKYPFAGVPLFLGFAIASLLFFSTYESFSSFLMLTFPMVVIALLYALISRK